MFQLQRQLFLKHLHLHNKYFSYEKTKKVIPGITIINYRRFIREARKKGYKTSSLIHAREVRKKELLKKLRNLAIKLGRTPNTKDLYKHKLYKAFFVYYFNSLSKAHQLAGLVPNKRGNYSLVRSKSIAPSRTLK